MLSSPEKPLAWIGRGDSSVASTQAFWGQPSLSASVATCEPLMMVIASARMHLIFEQSPARTPLVFYHPQACRRNLAAIQLQSNWKPWPHQDTSAVPGLSSNCCFYLRTVPSNWLVHGIAAYSTKTNPLLPGDSDSRWCRWPGAAEGSSKTVHDALYSMGSCGLMDKALVFGTKDCRFESCQDHLL